MKFLVGVREVHVSTREVDAENAIEAVRKIREGAGEEVMCEYSHTLDESLWTVEKGGRRWQKRVKRSSSPVSGSS